MTVDDTITGGCLCGAVRYEAGNRITGGVVCHCRMCQQASGGAFTVNAIYDRAQLRITKGEPRWYASSNIAERGFCEACGSPLLVRYSVPEWTNWIAVSVGSHDHPNDVPPERHFGLESRLCWLDSLDGLPGTEYPERFLEDVAVGENNAYAALPRRRE